MDEQLNFEMGRNWALNREEYTPDEYSLMEETATLAEQEGMIDLAAYERGVLSTRSSTVIVDGMALVYGE